ncbi:Hint domain-containing protein [Tritonibacter scottomollicae]|uniref:Hint domain-containing protein n=1 Tax=Tritonibacter scottomollicae TaxID=483013 RepID=A0A2T1AIR8_TRISK|nr:Hint domain-containing protein [Tritonibacter scottomollicae]PRZ48470.1 Hint domain-containing protein [Tritonibacter scottomollicae]
MNRDAISIQSLPAYQAEQFCVDIGANAGDPISVLDELVMDDIYELGAGATTDRLELAAHVDGGFSVHEHSALGTPDAALFLDCVVTLMPDRGAATDALILVEVDNEGLISQIYLVPQAPLMPCTGYRLVNASRHNVRQRLAQMTCVAFTRGTRISMSTGEQRLIEELTPGDQILTRDSGAQTITWIGRTTVRAVGEMAPILIRKGALNNARDLIVSPDHRLMVYQRSDQLGTGRAELLLRARDLVNGETVVVQDGGYVDYFQILFDRHYIIYAEGIAAESLFVDAVTKPVLPEDVRQRHVRLSRPHASRANYGLDVKREMLTRPDAVALLRRASQR